MADDQSCRGPVWPHLPGAAEAFGLLQCNLYVGDADVEDRSALIARSPANAATMCRR
jgi:hypothetical protein